MTDEAPKQVVVERLTVGFLPKAVAEMDMIVRRTGLSKTDIVNRAVAVLAFMEEQLAQGNELVIRDRYTGEAEKLHLL